MLVTRKKLKSMLPRLGTLLVLLSFGFMTGLAPVLHAHELDFNSSHDDCFSCHWSQSKGMDVIGPESVAAASQYQITDSPPVESLEYRSVHKLFNRGPPFLQ